MESCLGVLILFWKEAMTSFSRNLVASLPSPGLSRLLDLSVLSPVLLRVLMSEFLIATAECLAVTHWAWLLPSLPSALLLLFPEWFSIL